MFWKKKGGKKRTVLFVDDDPVVLRSLEKGLFDERYNKLFASSGEQALQILQREKVHVVVTDVRMPEMSGLELIETIEKEYPHIICMVLSGCGHEAEVTTAVAEGRIFKVTPKPWTLDETFGASIGAAVDQYNIQAQIRGVK